jgi:hypothetical protein
MSLKNGIAPTIMAGMPRGVAMRWAKRSLTAALLATLAACAGNHSDFYPTKGDVKPHPGVARAKQHPIQGIDISKWQGPIDWASVRGAGTQFAALGGTLEEFDGEPDPTLIERAHRLADVRVAGRSRHELGDDSCGRVGVVRRTPGPAHAVQRAGDLLQVGGQIRAHICGVGDRDLTIEQVCIHRDGEVVLGRPASIQRRFGHPGPLSHLIDGQPGIAGTQQRLPSSIENAPIRVTIPGPPTWRIHRSPIRYLRFVIR